MNLHYPPISHQPRATTLTAARPRAGLAAWRLDGRAGGELRSALEILAEQMHEAVARRRMSQPGTEAFRRADERIAYLIELFRRLQQRMAVPVEVWGLGSRPSTETRWPTVGARGLASHLSADIQPGLMKPSQDAGMDHTRHVRIEVAGLGCAGAGAASIEQELAATEGVLRVYVNPATETAYVDYNAAQTGPSMLARAIERAGYRPGRPVEA